MDTVLLLFVMTVADHKPPDYPKFFAVYRTELACEESAKQYMSLNGKAPILIKAQCTDARNPNLVPYLRNVPEIEPLNVNGGVIYPLQKDEKES